MNEDRYLVRLQLTAKEHAVLTELAAEMDLPIERVLVQALRLYQLVLHPVTPMPLASDFARIAPENTNQ